MAITAMTAEKNRTRASILQGKARIERPKAKANESQAWMMSGSTLLRSKPVTHGRQMKEAVYGALMMMPTVHGQ